MKPQWSPTLKFPKHVKTKKTQIPSQVTVASKSYAAWTSAWSVLDPKCSRWIIPPRMDYKLDYKSSTKLFIKCMASEGNRLKGHGSSKFIISTHHTKECTHRWRCRWRCQPCHEWPDKWSRVASTHFQTWLQGKLCAVHLSPRSIMAASCQLWIRRIQHRLTWQIWKSR